MGSDRNLLFGILAVQLNFVERDALLAAMSVWVLDKHRSLGEIMHDQGKLTLERHQLLEALVDEHVKAHDHSPHKSLAALSPEPALHRSLNTLDDGDVQASLEQFGQTHVPADSTTDWARSAGPRFRILRPHARGGLGEVFVAEDTELHREVALKEMQDRHARDTASRGRFLLEAEITAGLEHPSIVPVYGMGTYEDGRPFYAMRFIRGDSLKEALEQFHKQPQRDIAQRNLSFRQLLRRFVDVCNAIAYAHSRGVLHRDLKPGNIMLGKYGETLVVDWGLAKATGHRTVEPSRSSDEQTLVPSSGSSVVETVAGSAIGTPAYMSPEQAAGRLDELGPATDIYSLGATLYALLTGQPPVQGTDAPEILRKVQAGTFPSPRQVKPDVPAPLDAICRKAMALRPEARYQNALHLAQDVEKWLADEPVSVHRDPWLERGRRWARKHRTVVMSLGVLLVTAVLGLIVGLYVVDGERRQTLAAKEKTREALAQMAAARDRAEKARELATKHRDQALLSFANLTAIAHQTLGEGTTAKEQFDILLRIVERGVRKLLGDLPDEPDTEKVRGQIMGTLANTALQLNDLERAAREFDHCIEFWQRIARESPSASNFASVALYCMSASQVQDKLGHPEKAVALLKTSREYLDRVSKDPNSLGIGILYLQLANHYLVKRDFSEALAILQQALQMPPPAHDKKAIGLRQKIATTLDRLGRYQESEKLHLETIADAEAQVDSLKSLDMKFSATREDPSGPGDIQRLQSGYNALIQHYSKRGLINHAVAWQQKALTFLEKVVQGNPNPDSGRKRLMLSALALNWATLASLESRQKNFDQASEHVGKAVAIFESLEKAGDLRGVPRYEMQFSGVKSQREVLKLAPKCLADIQVVFAQPPERWYSHLMQRFEILHHSKEVPELITTAQAFAKLGDKDHLYSAACACSRASNSFDGKTAAALLDQSIVLLKRAVDGGYDDFTAIRTQADLAPLYARPEFQKLVSGKAR